MRRMKEMCQGMADIHWSLWRRSTTIPGICLLKQRSLYQVSVSKVFALSGRKTKINISRRIFAGTYITFALYFFIRYHAIEGALSIDFVEWKSYKDKKVYSVNMKLWNHSPLKQNCWSHLNPPSIHISYTFSNIKSCKKALTEVSK